MWPASHGASSARCPVRMLTTPPGTSEVASTSASSIAASGVRLRGEDDGRVAADDHRREARDEPVERRLVGRDDPDHAGRLRDREVEVRRRDRVRRAEHLRVLVGPARVPDPAIDRALDLLAARAELGELRACGPPSSPRCGRAPGRGCRRSSPAHFGNAPRAARTASRTSFRDARATFWPCASYVRPDSERGNVAADEELVRLPDRQPASSAAPRTLRYGSSPWRPPSRPKPDSL